MNTKKTKITAILVILVLALACLAGCGNKGIEGTWVLVEEYEASGKKISSKELQDMGISETYEISGTKVVYTCDMPKSKKPVVIKFDLEDLGNNKYNFKLKGKLVFASPEVKGNTMTYTVGKGKNETKMVFKRK